ncbi:MAG TPA: efflux RND transporter periplasmic adaptor subunit [Candidatus Elarobacter sp.]
MDIVREQHALRPGRLLGIAGLGAGVCVVGASIYFAMHVPRAAVVVERATVITDVARAGTLVSSIDEAGKLVSERIQIVSGAQPGRVRAVFVRAGAIVTAGTPIAQLDNPDLIAAAADAQATLTVAQAELQSARQQAVAAGIKDQADIKNAGSQHQLAQINYSAEKSLHARGLAASSVYRTAEINALQAERAVGTAREEAAVNASNQQAKIAAAQAAVQKAEARLTAQRAEIATLTIVAGADGVVQTVETQPGQTLPAGQEIAKVADQRSLKAVLQVPESQVHQVSLGMLAKIDPGNGTVMGRVSHIAPSASNGSVDVDVSFTRALPPGARPDLHVDGSIVLSRISNAVSIGRPAGASDNAEVSLFKVAEGGSRATRVRVRLGRGSADRVSVVSGLRAGDTVIISDMSKYDSQSEVRLQ